MEHAANLGYKAHISHYLTHVFSRRTRDTPKGPVTTVLCNTLCGQYGLQLIQPTQGRLCSSCERTYDREYKESEQP